MAVKGQLRERRHVSVDMTRGWLQTSPSGSFRPARSSSTRLQSFSRDVVVPEIQRQGISGTAMARSSSRRNLFKDCYSCFASSLRRTTTNDNDELQTSNLLKNNVDRGSATAPEAFTTSRGGAAKLANAAADHSAFRDHGARVDARAAAPAAASGEPAKWPRHRPKSKSMSFVQTSNAGAWGAAAYGASQWSLERKRDQAAAQQWAGSRGTSEIERGRFKAAATPMSWKQLMNKLRAQAKWHTQPQVRAAGSEWINYDSQSYAKNFDNGEWRDSCNLTSTYFDEEEEEDDEEKLGLRETALHTALLQKLYSKRGYKSSTAAAAAPAAQLLPGTIPVTSIRPCDAKILSPFGKDDKPYLHRSSSSPSKPLSTPPTTFERHIGPHPSRRPLLTKT